MFRPAPSYFRRDYFNFHANLVHVMLDIFVYSSLMVKKDNIQNV